MFARRYVASTSRLVHSLDDKMIYSYSRVFPMVFRLASNMERLQTCIAFPTSRGVSEAFSGVSERPLPKPRGEVIHIPSYPRLSGNAGMRNGLA